MNKPFDLKAFVLAVVVSTVILIGLIALSEVLGGEGILATVVSFGVVLAAAFAGAAYGRFHHKTPSVSKGHLVGIGALTGLIAGAITGAFWGLVYSSPPDWVLGGDTRETYFRLHPSELPPMVIEFAIIGAIVCALIAVGGALADYKNYVKSI
jgi:hypothetical protein